MVRTSLDSAIVADVVSQLSGVGSVPPGAPVGRQPVHTCYVPADVVTADLLPDWGAQALAAMDAHAPTPQVLSTIVDLPAHLADAVHARVRAKLRREPIEDLRIDFEDGYGVRADAAEDADADRAATVVAGWHAASTAPLSVGIRFKSFDTTALLERGVRTLDVFVTALVDRAGGLPPGVVLTFPKVTSAEQVRALGELLDPLERRLGIRERALRFEIQIETPQSIVDNSGRVAVPGLIAAGRGRVTGLHFGTYDYTTACGLDAGQQHLAHGACDFARSVMQVSAAGTGVALCDGSTNILPVGDLESVHHGWRTHYRLVRRSLEHGFRQGWDLHPVQLVTRYAATYAYYLAGTEGDARRLAAYLGRSPGAVLDEPATVRALAGSLLRAVDCGALDADELARLTGVSTADIATLAGRR
jgi:citrate lyase beta subunit